MNIGDGGIFLRFATVRSRFCHGSSLLSEPLRVSALLRGALGSGIISENVNSVWLLQARDTTLSRGLKRVLAVFFIGASLRRAWGFLLFLNILKNKEIEDRPISRADATKHRF